MSRVLRRLAPAATAVLSGLVVIALAFRRLIFEPGLVIYRDLYPGQLHYPNLWHPLGSFMAMENYKFVTFAGPFLPLQQLGTDIFEKAVYLAAPLIAYLAFYTASYRTLGYVRRSQDTGLVRHVASGLGAAVFILNPAAANIYFDFALFVGYAFAPLTLLIYGEVLAGRRRTWPGALLVAVIWWISAIKAHFIVFGGLLLIPPFLCWTIRPKQWSGRQLWRNIQVTAVILGLYLLLGSYWLVPYLQASQERFVGSMAPMTFESVAFLSYTPWYNVVRLMGAFQAWPYVTYGPTGGWLNPLWYLSSWVLPALAVAGVAWHRRSWVTWMLASFSMAGLVLAKGTAPPLGELYQWLVFGPLTPAAFRWLFRVASKWNVFLSLGACGLVTIALAELMARVRSWRRAAGPMRSRARMALLALVGSVLAFPLFAWPSFSGDFGGALDPVPLPPEMLAANGWLEAQEGDFKVNWMPVTNGRELSWNPRPSGSVYTSLSSRPSIATNWNRHPVLYYSYAYDSVSNDRLGDLGQLLSVLNTRYVAYHDDVVTTHVHEGVEPVAVLIESGEQDLTEKIDEQRDMRVAWTRGAITIYEAELYEAGVFAPASRFLATGDLTLLASLSSLGSVDLGELGLYFDSSRDRGRLTGDWDGLLLGLDAIDDLAISFLPVERLISPAAYTSHGSVTDAWSRFDIYQFDWQSVLRDHYVYQWAYDYGQAMVAHTAAAGELESDVSFSVPVVIADDGTYHLLARYLEHPLAGSLSVAVDGESAVDVVAANLVAGFRWNDVGSLPLTAGEHRVEFANRDGFMVLNALAVLEETELARLLEQVDQLAASTPSLYVLEVERDFDPGDALPSRETTQLSGGRGLELDSGTPISTTVSLVAGGDYSLWVRASLPVSSAPITATLGNEELVLESGFLGEELIWLTEPTPSLPKGELTVTLQSAGPAVVDVVLLDSGEPSESPGALLTSDSVPPSVTYQRIDPTRYRVLVQTERPFTLALAETYDPLWEAYGADFRVSSIPLYGVINGFTLDRTGTYEVTVEFQAQQGARLGAILSATVGIGLGPLVLYMARRHFPKKNTEDTQGDARHRDM